MSQLCRGQTRLTCVRGAFIRDEQARFRPVRGYIDQILPPRVRMAHDLSGSWLRECNWVCWSSCASEYTCSTRYAIKLCGNHLVVLFTNARMVESIGRGLQKFSCKNWWTSRLSFLFIPIQLRLWWTYDVNTWGSSKPRCPWHRWSESGWLWGSRRHRAPLRRCLGGIISFSL